MFGLFKQKMPSDQLRMLENYANDSIEKIAENYQDGKLKVKGKYIDISASQTRHKILNNIQTMLSVWSQNPNQWTNDMKKFYKRIERLSGAENIHPAAPLIFAPLAQMEILCMWVMKYYPNDTRAKHIIGKMLAINGKVIDEIFSFENKRGQSNLESSPSLEIYSEFKFISRFLDSWTGF